MTEWWGILRCRTWHFWPEGMTSDFAATAIDYGAESPVQVHTFVDSYNRAQPNVIETSELGPTTWPGYEPGVHRIWNSMLLGVGEQFQLEPQPLRHAHRGELDIRLSFHFGESPPEALREALKERAYEIVGLLNVGQGDFVAPSAPFQLLQLLPGGQTATEQPIALTIRDRHVLGEDTLNSFLARARDFLTGPVYGPKHRVALELYAAHFAEGQVRVRFILLVIAMEALAENAPKHQVALDVLARWRQDLDTELTKYDEHSDEFYSLKALSGELSFRRGDSINNQVRKLFAALPGFSDEECKALQRRAVAVYAKRSTLVHEGYLPTDELPTLEAEARELLDALFSSYLQVHTDAPGTTVVEPR